MCPVSKLLRAVLLVKILLLKLLRARERVRCSRARCLPFPSPAMNPPVEPSGTPAPPRPAFEPDSHRLGAQLFDVAVVRRMVRRGCGRRVIRPLGCEDLGDLVPDVDPVELGEDLGEVLVELYERGVGRAGGEFVTDSPSGCTHGRADGPVGLERATEVLELDIAEGLAQSVDLFSGDLHLVLSLGHTACHEPRIKLLYKGYFVKHKMREGPRGGPFVPSCRRREQSLPWPLETSLGANPALRRFGDGCVSGDDLDVLGTLGNHYSSRTAMLCSRPLFYYHQASDM